MIAEVITGLEAIARVAKNAANPAETVRAIQSVRDLVQSLKTTEATEIKKSLSQLDSELSTWQSKLDVILKESVGRQGIAKHAHYWVERLEQLKTQN